MIEFIGVDHGFKNMKTASHVFPTALTELAARPDDLSGVIEYNNKYYSLHGSPLVSVNNHDKIQTMDFYILTLAALAKELKSRKGKRSATIRLAAGLPQKWYSQQKKDFKSYLSKESIVKFEFEGEKFKIEISNVGIFAQGYAAALTKLSSYKGKEIVVVDIGGETIDIIRIGADGKPIESECKIDLHGMIWLINEIKEAVESELMETVPESVIQDYILNHTKKDAPDNAYEKIFQKKLVEYSHYVFTRLREFKINPELVPLLFEGGGATVVHRYGTYGKNVDFILDISANAKGFEMIDKKMFAVQNEKGKK